MLKDASLAGIDVLKAKDADEMEVPFSIEDGNTPLPFEIEATETVVLPESVKTIGRYAFAGAVSLVSADLPDTVTELGSHAFFGCSSLTNAVIPVGVTRLAPSVFEDCTSLETVVRHDGIKTIGESAFEGCTLLTNINVPITAAVKDYAFDGCAKLDSQKN